MELWVECGCFRMRRREIFLAFFQGEEAVLFLSSEKF